LHRRGSVCIQRTNFTCGSLRLPSTGPIRLSYWRC
jgi:hypothetical protein